MIERAVKAYQAGTFLQEFHPCPPELLQAGSSEYGGENAERNDAIREANRAKYGYANWYDWCVANWGTKWDIGGRGEFAEQPDANTLELRFDSAWSPPTQAYEKLVGLGFTILAYYYEPGMGFAGKWEGNEDDYFDDYYELGGMNSDEIAATLPDDLDECFAISENVAEWQEQNNDVAE